ncbi:thiamine pyrophosphate-dependent enzyme [Caballeronia sp. LjRoot34]|uniref:thiamine pyrophosphate-dependent enzyme n=1 Tax=Caballeronia sp. LjRoot34 TaxID=3342325 RepID=UPI003ECEA474
MFEGVGSFTHDSMANALPQAIGIQCAEPSLRVVTFSGDGGLSMLMADLITLKQMNLPVKVVVFNMGPGFVALEVTAVGFLEIGVDLENPDFAAIARANVIHALWVDDPADLVSASNEILGHAGPAFLDVVTTKHELSMSPTISRAEVWGLQPLDSSRADERAGDSVIDLAKTNFLGR